jgi:dTDP-3-amino-2,3,6-trideoxy-4-keto-D-glucose/dTDP-3-amino-3,4,6-trideoxy-alpha-D-glucose/dTDP-2,6-dideoxy-D-kanosamine transaminase
MKVPFGYLDRQFANPDAILEDIREFVKTGDFTLGKAMVEFEERFATALGVKFAIGVGSGTDALFLSLKALGIGHSDEVITAANTFVATAGAIVTAGAKLVFVDCNTKYVIDENKIEAAITANTKAIMPVHYSGQPCHMPKIMAIAKKHNIAVIEDACQAIGAKYEGITCGNYGILTGFSFHPLKNLNIWSDGGMIVTNSEELKDKLCLMRNHGMINRDEYVFYAYNSRLDTIQAIVGNHMIKGFEKITQRRIDIARKYDEAFSNLKGPITIPKREDNERHVFHLYMLLVDRRDELNSFLHSHEIESKIHYPIPLHMQPASKPFGYKKGDFPVAETQAENLITLPAHPYLTDEEVNFTIEKVQAFYFA